MPHIYINEIDNTVAGSSAENTNVVYIPGVKESGGTIEVGKPTLFNKNSAFLTALTGTSTGTISATNLNALMARELISLGMTVLFEAFTVSPASGQTQEEAIAQAVDWTKLTDKSLYKIKFLTCGAASALVTNTAQSKTIASLMLACANKRGDCIALIDHAQTITPTSGQTVAQNVYAEFATAGVSTDANAKFGAAFSPWCKFNIGTSGTTLPGSFAFLSAYAKAVQTNPNWYAAAGFLRGQIPGISEPVYKYGDADCAVLQARDITESGDFGSNDNKSYAINPISEIDAAGFIIWGNRTLLNNQATGGLTASSLLNVRNLCCDIKKNLYRAARKYTFEQNNDILWVNFCSEISPLLDRALSGGGIRGYKLIKRPTNVKGRLSAVIKIIPIEAVEDFELTVEMVDSIETVTESV